MLPILLFTLFAISASAAPAAPAQSSCEDYYECIEGADVSSNMSTLSEIHELNTTEVGRKIELVVLCNVFYKCDDHKGHLTTLHQLHIAKSEVQGFRSESMNEALKFCIQHNSKEYMDCFDAQRSQGEPTKERLIALAQCWTDMAEKSEFCTLYDIYYLKKMTRVIHLEMEAHKDALAVFGEKTEEPDVGPSK